MHVSSFEFMHTQGGLNMSLEAFTLPISCGGAVLILYSLTVYPHLIKALGCLKLARLALLAAVPCTLLLPVSSLLSPYVMEQVKHTADLQSMPNKYEMGLVCISY